MSGLIKKCGRRARRTVRRVQWIAIALLLPAAVLYDISRAVWARLTPRRIATAGAACTAGLCYLCAVAEVASFASWLAARGPQSAAPAAAAAAASQPAHTSASSSALPSTANMPIDSYHGVILQVSITLTADIPSVMTAMAKASMTVVTSAAVLLHLIAQVIFQWPRTASIGLILIGLG